jgi:hypothetical protein
MIYNLQSVQIELKRVKIQRNKLFGFKPVIYGAVVQRLTSLPMVQSRWDDAEAAKCNGDLLALRVYTSRLMCAPAPRAPA